MIKKDLPILLTVGVALATFVWWSQFLTSVSFASQTQLPINPDSLTGDYDFDNSAGVFHGQPVLSQELAFDQSSVVLGDSTKPKRIEIDLTNQRLYAFEGDEKIYDFLISSGKWGKTPTGTFQIWGKFRFTKMEGGNKALNSYYYLPNVPYVMFFANDQVAAARGFSIHGTYWHNNFGHPMSHGCINMKTSEAALIYSWANPDLGSKKSGRTTQDNPGTQVTIYGVAPKT